MKKLSNNRLNITFADKTDYQAARFDHCGIIKDIILDNKYSFATTEVLTDDELQNTRGIGLCNEFGLESALGFEENIDYFIKIGVGEVVNSNDASSNLMVKKDNSHTDIHESFTSKSATFKLTQSSENGYAYEYEKKIVLVDNTIEIYTTLKNTGERFIDTAEYYHNFINLDNDKIDENYVLTVDSIPSNWHSEPVGQLKINENTFYFTEKVSEVFYARAYNPNGMSTWTLTNKKTGLSMSEHSENKVTKFAIWGLPHVYSSELFTDIKIATNETYTNKRTFSFNSNDFTK